MSNPHIIAVPFPAQGHVIPLMELSQCLVNHGFRVTFVNTDYNHKQVVNALAADESQLSDRICLVSLPGGLEPWEARHEVGKLCEATERVMPGKLEELIEKINQGEGDKVTCVIADECSGWALEVAEKLNIRRVAFYPASAAILTLQFSIPKLIHQGIINDDGTVLRSQMIQLAPGMPTMKTTEFLWACMGDLTAQKIVFQVMVRNNKAAKLAEWIVCNSAYELEPAAFTVAPEILPIGPLLASSRLGNSACYFWPQDSTCLQWLDQQPPCSVIYVAFGHHLQLQKPISEKTPSSNQSPPSHSQSLCVRFQVLGVWVFFSSSDLEMGTLGTLMKHPDDIYPLLKLKMAAKNLEKQIPPEPHWAFCYSMLHKVSRSFALVIQQLGTELRNAVCIFYLVLRALDTVEDDTSIAADVKVPILIAFHRHIYDPDWHFSCGTKDYKVLMDQFHHVSTAFLELGKGYQEAIEDITKRMGAGMAKFICKEVETIDDYDEYCHYVAGLVGLGLSKLFHAADKEDLASDSLSNSMGLFLQKTNIIRDYLEDINEIPKSRMFWPRQIWSKYVNKLEDLKYEENSDKAVQCLNDMVTNALIHMEDCLKYMAALRDPAIFKFCAIPQIMAIGTLALCYNNIELFRGVVKMRRGLTAKVIDRTKSMDDVYGAFFDFSSILKSKVDKNDPNATKTLSRLEAVQKTCRASGALSKRKSYIVRGEPSHNSTLIVALFIILAIVYAYLSASPRI